MLDIQAQLEVIQKGVAELLPLDELVVKLKEQRPLRIKVGFDPTAPDLHFGHTVILTKMRQLQDLGHQIHFLIGDFTGLIGDPSGRNVTRPPLSPAEIEQNAITYATQVFKILDKDLTKIEFNSKWLGVLKASDILQLTAAITVARMLERDDFSKRFKANKSIMLHEFLYPLLQGYDSFAMNTDIELGGIDQKFNLLMGRELQKHFKQSVQVILMMPLLEGLDGVNKMSKSLNNYIAIQDAPNDMFGKIMSISDELMWRYYELLSLKSIHEINQLKEQMLAGKNPRDIKVILAMELVERYHGTNSATEALKDFETRFSKQQIPDKLPLIEIQIANESIDIAILLKQANLVPSTAQGLRMIEQGAVKIAGDKVSDKKLPLYKNNTYIIQVGKRVMAEVIIK
jgi:tyrosyl-tRNA synthetase